MSSRETARILVVEDDHAIRQLIVWMLEDRGYMVTSAGNGRDAVEIAAAWRPDLVILDLGLPYIDGVGVSSHVRELGEHAPRVIVVSADRAANQKALAMGAFTLITKPFDIDVLTDAVELALEKPAAASR